MKKCAVCGEIVEDGVDVCPVCKAKKFVPVAADTKYACEPARSSRFFLVEGVTTSPKSSANLDACSASSNA